MAALTYSLINNLNDLKTLEMPHNYQHCYAITDTCNNSLNSITYIG